MENHSHDVDVKPALTARQRRACLRRALRLRQRGRELYEQADQEEANIRRSLPAGGQITLEDGRRFHVVDNFSERNVVFRPAAVRRFEIVEVKEKRE